MKTSLFLVAGLCWIGQISAFSASSYLVLGKSSAFLPKCAAPGTSKHAMLPATSSLKMPFGKRQQNAFAVRMGMAQEELNSKLREAAECGNVSELIDLAKLGADVNSYDGSRQNKAGIHFAAHQVRRTTDPAFSCTNSVLKTERLNPTSCVVSFLSTSVTRVGIRQIAYTMCLGYFVYIFSRILCNL